MSGFLGTGASFAADLNLALQLSMAAALGVGMALARRKHYRAHAVCQSAVVLLNLALIAVIMLPAFRLGVLPGLPARPASVPKARGPGPPASLGAAIARQANAHTTSRDH